ncbi:hypothetical protein KY289_004187 [Solanum tuberosum]|nr:hypothetical protein KY289_004187 [Solanum tuberosum]
MFKADPGLEGKNQALKWIYGDEGLQYGKLLSYRAELLRSNPGSNGLIGAVKDLCPEAERRNCVRHMYQNFKKKQKGKALKDFVWNAARASNKVIFHKCMEELDQEDKAAREWFNNPERPFQSWTRALIRTNTKCDMLLNNFCESFNR